MNTSNNNNNNINPITDDCYFNLDTVIEDDVVAGNVITNDAKAEVINTENNFHVENNAEFKKRLNVSGLTASGPDENGAAMNITTSSPNISIDLHGNRLSNVCRPKKPYSPVPAYYLRAPEYYFCSLRHGGRIDINTSKPVALAGPNRTVYQTLNIFSHIRFIDYDKDTGRVTSPGKTAIQCLSAGTYMFDLGLTKRWGWNNGWGGDVEMLNGKDELFCSNTIYGGGGFSLQGCLSATYKFDTPSRNPNGTLDEEDKKHVFRFQLKQNKASLSAFYFGVIFYPEEAYVMEEH